MSRAACNAHKSHLHLNPDSIGRLLYGPRARFVDALCIAVSSLRAAWPFSQIVYGHSRLRKEGAEGRGQREGTSHRPTQGKSRPTVGSQRPYNHNSHGSRDSRHDSVANHFAGFIHSTLRGCLFYRVLFLMHNFQSTRVDVGNTMRGF